MEGAGLGMALAGGAILAAGAAVHLYWGAGGRFGAGRGVPEVGGRPAFRPSRAACAGVGVLLVAAGLLLAIRRYGLEADLRAERARLDLPWTALACGALALAFAGRAIGDFRLVGLFKRIRGTRFAVLDTWIYSPLCLVVAAAFASSALGVG